MIEMSTIASLALRTSLLLVFVGAACALLAHKSATYRHLLWTAALALSLLLPLAMACLPSWAVIPAFWQSSAWEPLEAGTSEPSAMLAATHSLWPGIAMVWAIGALGLLLRDLLAGVGLMRWMRRARPLRSPRWNATLRGLSGEVRIVATLRIFESARVTSPCTWGFARPVLLLPLAGAEWTESRRRAALLHELAHIRRLDYVSAFVARLACAMHWYNPLVWWAAAQAGRLQEQACDDAVLLAGGQPTEYAQFLLDVAGASSEAPGPLRVAIGMMRRSPLRSRVIAILDARRARVQPNRWAICAALVILCGLTVVLAAAAAAPELDTKQVRPTQAVAPHAVGDRIETQAAAPAATPMAAEQAAPVQSTVADASEPAPGDERPMPPKAPRPPPAVQTLEALPPVPSVPPAPPVTPVPALAPLEPLPALQPLSHADHESRPFRAPLLVQAQ